MLATKILTIEIPESLYRQFVGTVTKQDGAWRNRRKQQTFNEAIKSAFVASLIHFLRSLEDHHRLPDFRDYMLEKYPEIDDDLITMIEDLIKRQKEKISFSALRMNDNTAITSDILSRYIKECEEYVERG